MDRKSRVAKVRRPSDNRRPRLYALLQIPALIYSLISGVVSLMAGALVSLAASGSARLALWSAVTGITAMGAGVVYESRMLKFWCSAFGRWIR